MSQIALTCAWGEPQYQNRTVRVGGESIHRISCERNYLYGERVVTAYQD